MLTNSEASDTEGLTLNDWVERGKNCLAFGDLAAATEAIEMLRQAAPQHHDLGNLEKLLSEQLLTQRERTVAFRNAETLGFGVIPNPLFGCDCYEGAFACVVSRMSATVEGMPGPAERSGLVNIGDVVTAVSGVSTAGMTYEACNARIKHERASLNGTYFSLLQQKEDKATDTVCVCRESPCCVCPHG
jgi:hypothetical protein